MLKKSIRIISILMVGIFFISVTVDYIILLINDESVSYLQFMRLYNRFKQTAHMENQKIVNMKQEAINYVIQSIVLKQEAEKKGLVISNEDVNNHINSIMAYRGLTRDDLERDLKMQGVSYEDFYETLRYQLIVYSFIQRFIEPKVPTMTKKEIQGYYDENKNAFKGSYEYTIAKIYLDVSSNATFKEILLKKRVLEALKAEIQQRKNESIPDIVADFNKKNKETITYSEAVLYPELEAKEFSDKITGLAINEMSDIITYNGDYYLIWVKKRQAIEYIPLVSVSDKIINYLKEKIKIELFEEYVNNLVKDADIQWLKDSESIVLED